MIEYISSFNNIKRIDSVSSVVREGKSSDTLLDLLLDLLLDNGPRVQDGRIPRKWMRREKSLKILSLACPWPVLGVLGAARVEVLGMAHS